MTNNFDDFNQTENFFNIGLTNNTNTTKNKLPINSFNLLTNEKPMLSEQTNSGTELHTPSIYIMDNTNNNTIQKNGFKWD